MGDIDITQEVVGRIYIGRVINSRAFIGQVRKRRHLESCQYIVGEVYEGCRCIRKTNGRREDYGARLYRARLRNH